jgi:hypothetical protein
LGIFQHTFPFSASDKIKTGGLEVIILTLLSLSKRKFPLSVLPSTNHIATWTGFKVIKDRTFRHNPGINKFNVVHGFSGDIRSLIRMFYPSREVPLGCADWHETETTNIHVFQTLSAHFVPKYKVLSFS